MNIVHDERMSPRLILKFKVTADKNEDNLKLVPAVDTI